MFLAAHRLLRRFPAIQFVLSTCFVFKPLRTVILILTVLLTLVSFDAKAGGTFFQKVILICVSGCVGNEACIHKSVFICVILLVINETCSVPSICPRLCSH